MLRSSHGFYAAALGSAALAGIALSLIPTDSWAQAARNVDCNKCVDTGDLAKKAVNKKKLAKGSVNSSKIADGTVEAEDIADGAVGESKLAAGAVTGGKLADGAVVRAKLAPGAVDESKLAAAAVSTGKIADGAVTMTKLAPDAVFGRIIVVRADPLDPIGNCGALQDALAGITDNDADNPYTIHLESGVYNCGPTQVIMKPNIDLQGSGRDVTRIRGSVNNSALVRAAEATELRSLTVENRNTSIARGIRGGNVTSFRITDVTVITPNAGDTSTPIDLSGDTTAILTNVIAEAGGPAANGAAAIVIEDNVEASLVNVTARTTGEATGTDRGLQIGGTSTVTVRNSVVRGSFAFLIKDSSVAYFVSTQLDADFGTPCDPGSTGSFDCVGAYDRDFDPLSDEFCS